MLGAIGHARLMSGRRSQVEDLIQEWQQTIRPHILGGSSSSTAMLMADRTSWSLWP